MLVTALRARDQQLGLVIAAETAHSSTLSTEPPLNLNSRRDIPVGSTYGHNRMNRT